MRALSASVLMSSMVLSSMVLGGWLTGAKAQNLDLDTPPALNSTPGDQAGGPENLPPGVIPQPGINSPGVVTGVTLGELYTDNLKLAAGDKPKQAAWITQIRPFIKAARSSPRFSGVFDYALTGYVYEGGASHNQLSQNLDANGTLTILPQHFFLDGSARYGSQIINNELPAGSGTFFLNNNRANVGIASLSPYWLQDLGRVGIMTLRYTRGRVVYDDRGIPGENAGLLSGIPNVTLNAAQFSLVSPEYQTWGWNLGYSEQRLDPDFGPGLDFAVAKLGTSFQVNNNLQLLANGGKENKFLPDGTMQKLGSPFWDAGFRWSNTRDDFKFMVGHRFFGRSFQLSWTHQAALLTTNVSYVEQPTSYNQQLLGMNQGAASLPPIGIVPNIPSLTERQPYLSKRLLASAVYTMPKSRLSVGVYDESRTYFDQNSPRERVANANVSWLFNVDAFTTLTPSVRWQRYQFQDGQTNNTRYLQLALVHQINAKNFGSVRLRHDVGDGYFESPDASVVDDGALGAFLTAHGYSASSDAHGYSVNVIFVQWTHLF